MALNMKIKGFSTKKRARGPQDQSQLDQADMTVGIARALKYAQNKPVSSQREAKAAIKDALIVIEKAIMGIDAVKDILRQAREIVETAKTSHHSDMAATLAKTLMGCATNSISSSRNVSTREKISSLVRKPNSLSPSPMPDTQILSSKAQI